MTVDSVNIQKISDEGSEIYEKIKHKYLPDQVGKFLAIEIESGQEYLADTSAEALDLASISHPDKVFYVVKIGFEVAETVARSFMSRN